MFHVKPSIIIGASSPNREMEKICGVFNNRLGDLARSHCVYFWEPTSVYWDDSTNKRNWIGVAFNDPSLTDATHFSTEAGRFLDQRIADDLVNLNTLISDQIYLANCIIKPLLAAIFTSRYSSRFKVFRLYYRFSPRPFLKKFIDALHLP